MFLIRKDTELTTAQLGKIIQKFQLNDLPKMTKYYNYYKGRMAIMNKVATDVGKPCNRVVVNYCSNIVETYTGYMTGIDITYSGDNVEDIIDVLNYNDVHSADTSFLRNALIFGRAAELNYIDANGMQRFKGIDPREIIDVYDDTVEQNLVYAIRFYRADYIEDNTETYIIEVYDSENIYKYRSNASFSSMEMVEEPVPHFFKQVPITFFSLNDENDSIFDKVMSLNDAYNELLSGEVDSWDAFSDAYLILKGCDADGDDLRAMKENRVLILDADADASYLTKNVSDTQVENMLTNINMQIHKVALSPDFNDEKFMSTSGIAIKYKLMGMENNASAIESNMRKALQKRVELICSILSLKGDSVWRDINIIFTRNLPENTTEIAAMVNSLRGLVSDYTLLGLLPFIDNVDEEMDRIKAQKESDMSLYQFGDSNEQ